MANPGDTRREYLKLPAVDPFDGKRCEIQISFDRMQTVARRGMGHTRECAFTVPAILLRPTAIFEGLRQDVDEDRHGVGWRCYCGKPEHAYRSDGTERPPYPDQVFLVFVNDDGIAYNWRWDKADPDDTDLPENHAIRFRKRLL